MWIINWTALVQLLPLLKIEQPIAAQYFGLYADPSDIGKNADGPDKNWLKAWSNDNVSGLQKFELQTDPRDALSHAHRIVVHKGGCSAWWTGNRPPSPVYHTKRPPKLTTLATADVQLRNFSKSRVSDKVPERSTPICEIREFPSYKMWDKSRVTSTPKTSSIRWSRFDTILTCDRQTDGQTYTALAPSCG